MSLKSIKQHSRFDFIPEPLWKKLTKKEFSDLMSYKGVYSHLKKSLDEIEKCKKRIKVLKDKLEGKDGYYKKLKTKTKEIDHLRDTYNITCSITVGKRHTNTKSGITTEYWNLIVSRRNNTPLSTSWGNDKKIKDYLNEFYKDDNRTLGMIKKKGWLPFLKNECKYGIKWTSMEFIIDKKGRVGSGDFTMDVCLPK